MCVLICRVGEHPLLAANRDERYARPFVAPDLWEAPTPFWAPRDEEEGGSCSKRGEWRFCTAT